MARRTKKKRPQHAGLHPVRGGVAVVAAPEAELRRGLDAFQRGDYGGAIQAWERARRGGGPAGLERTLAEAHFRRALVGGNDARRAPDLQEAVALAPERAIYHFH